MSKRLAMKRPSESLIVILLPSLVAISIGCQRSMNGSTAGSPFAPAGSTATANSSPLFPVGPITGATRVPPPATGSANPGNSYLGTPSAAMPQSNSPSNSSFAAAPASFSASAPTAASAGPNDTFRNSLGGMPVIDLTTQAQIPAAGNFAQGPAVGSGLASAPPVQPYAQPNMQPYAQPQRIETSAWATLPSDRLRPIDGPYAAAPVPQYRGYGTPASVSPASSIAVPSHSGVVPAGGVTSSDPWQSTQPVPANGYVATSSGAAPVGVRADGPSTDPVTNSGTSASAPGSSTVPTSTASSNSLPWRSPTTAR